MVTTVAITSHTTASVPRPHVVYNIEAINDGEMTKVSRRYSEFTALHETLRDPFVLPPKRILATTFIPSAWVDDALIKERKEGLTTYLNKLSSSPAYQESAILSKFLTPDVPEKPQVFNPEDALPSTLSRKAAMSMATDLEVTGSGFDTQATAIAAAYYPDWSAGTNPPEGLNFSKFDILFFAFVMPNSSSTITWDSGGEAVLQRLVNAKKVSGANTKIVLSIGGWGGSVWFSQSCSSAANRSKLVNALVSAVNKYGLDGVDVDWEYPNSTGAGNPHSPNDAANLLNLFKALRSALPRPKIISAAVPHLPWLGTDGRSLSNVSAYATVMDYVNIMNYDVWGASANPGPNAPMADLCGTSKQPQANAQAALNQWKKAGFPASKLLLGLPLYGYVSNSTKKVLTGGFAPTANMVLLAKSEEVNANGEKELNFLNGAHVRSRVPSIEEEQESVEVNAADTKRASILAANLQRWWGQQIPFKEIVKAGALVKKSDGSYGEGGGFTMGWDDCSNTPYLFNTSQSTVVTYDDTWSLADKAKLAKSNGMAGCFTWSLDQDDGYTLQNVIRKNLGK